MRLVLDDVHAYYGQSHVIQGISLTVGEGETVGVVGESGSGKSLTARSVLGLLPDASVAGGSVRLDGHEVLTAGTREILQLRRTDASMVFQDPRAGINPMLSEFGERSEATQYAGRKVGAAWTCPLRVRT